MDEKNNKQRGNCQMIRLYEVWSFRLELRFSICILGQANSLPEIHNTGIYARCVKTGLGNSI